MSFNNSPNMISRIFLAVVFAAMLFPSAAFGQMAGKPSPSKEPAGSMPETPDSKKTSLPRVESQAEFDSIARTYHQNTPYALPHAMFVIDRRNKNKIYFVNSQRYKFHKDFLLATYLVPRGADVFKPIYIDADRRFIVGTIAWQRTVEKFTWELWEGDLATADHIKAANVAINKGFFAQVHYKPNSLRQEDVSATMGIDRVLQSDISKNQEYLALNPGKAVGRIHIIDKLDDTVEVGDNEILVLNELPISLPPVRGIILTKPSSPLSHINILAKNWNIPNVYIKDADKLFAEKNTFVWELDAGMTAYKWNEINDPAERHKKFASPDQQVAPSNLAVTKLAGLREMRARDSIVYGAKAANLGEIINGRVPGIIVPDGFSVPFHYYDKFMRDNGFDREIEDLMEDLNFVHNPKYRRQKLDEFRKKIENGKFDPVLQRQITTKWRTQLGSRAVFVRSSSNAEDLPKFSGAGLYSSVFNVKTPANLINGVKKVWSSLWKFEAYEARVRNYVDQKKVYMSALIQVGIDMQKGGVLITKDPFDADNKNAVYISAVCGHNSRVVNNSGLPEQIMFNPKSNSIVVMTMSDQENSLRFGAAGDLKQVTDKCANAQGRVLTDLQARNLATAATRIEKMFGKVPQDIEWGIMLGQLYVVQARPYQD
jgi:phosphoenolpyruvate synthase/pyruvate phosphate dikinase